jgi:hypothetical protein
MRTRPPCQARRAVSLGAPRVVCQIQCQRRPGQCLHLRAREGLAAARESITVLVSRLVQATEIARLREREGGTPCLCWATAIRRRLGRARLGHTATAARSRTLTCLQAAKPRGSCPRRRGRRPTMERSRAWTPPGKWVQIPPRPLRVCLGWGWQKDAPPRALALLCTRLDALSHVSRCAFDVNRVVCIQFAV